MKISKPTILSLILLMFLNLQIKVSAEQNIKTLRMPIPFEVKGKLDPININIGESVELVTPDDIICKNFELKKNTILIGKITRFKTSKRYRRNGYFQIAIDSINFPDKGLISLKKPLNIKIYNPEMMHRKGKPAWMKTSEGILFCSDCAIGGTSLPLYIYEDFKWDETMKDKSNAYKWGNVLSKTLVVYYVYDFFKKYPDPDYKDGDIINIKFKKKISKELFVFKINSAQKDSSKSQSAHQRHKSKKHEPV